METEEKKDQATEDELAAYEKLRQRLSRTLTGLNDRINKETISQAMDSAVEELKEIGGHSMEAIGKASAAMKKDITTTSAHLKPKMDETTEIAKKQFDHWSAKGGALWHDIVRETEHVYEYSRDKGGSFLVSVARSLSEWSHHIGDKLDTSLKYKTGEITHGGEFTCTNCEAEIHLKHPGRLPPCPKCRKTVYRRT